MLEIGNLASCGLFLITIIITISAAFSNIEPLTLTILHTNDIHSRFLETDSFGLSCSQQEKEEHKCYGGFSRINYEVTEIRKTHPNVVYLSAGDYFRGTVWYTFYKWKLLAYFTNKFNHTAMVLGNHEFDDGVEGLLPFLKHVNFPVISANIDMSGEPQMAKKVQKSIVVQYEGRKVGIIGYTTKETPDLSDVGNLVFEDEIIAVTKEAKRLNKNGIKIIIALGHSGYDLDMKVAKIPFIDVVVGGHTNTFLYTGKPLPDIELPAGKYPTVIESNGRNVPVVQAYAFGKYLGYLNVTFNNEGDLISWAGNPILLDSSIPQDLKMEAELERKGKKFLKKMKREVGKTEILLDGLQSCRMKECIMGNVLADAIVEYVNNVLATKRSNKIPRVSMSILSGGMLRASIPSNRTITLEDCLTVFPFSDTIDVIEVTGKHLRTIFEFSMAQYDQTGISHTGKFLQVSGIRVTFDLKRNPGNRVVELSTLLPRDGNDTRNYEPIQDERNYMMGISSYTASGGDGYQIIPQKLINKYESNTQVFDALLAYIRYHSPISRILGNRTQLLLDKSKPAWSELIK